MALVSVVQSSGRVHYARDIASLAKSQSRTSYESMTRPRVPHVHMSSRHTMGCVCVRAVVSVGVGTYYYTLFCG